jgi:hypothetical protein
MLMRTCRRTIIRIVRLSGSQWTSPPLALVTLPDADHISWFQPTLDQLRVQSVWSIRCMPRCRGVQVTLEADDFDATQSSRSFTVGR